MAPLTYSYNVMIKICISITFFTFCLHHHLFLPLPTSHPPSPSFPSNCSSFSPLPFLPLLPLLLPFLLLCHFRYSPIGIASIIAGKLLEVESFAVLVQEIGLYTVTVLAGLIIHGCIVLPLIYLILTRRNPLKMVRAALLALLTAFGTSSR